MRVATFGFFGILAASYYMGSAAWGASKQDGGQAGSFLNFAASARSLGMGQAHVGVADDASATYWNPAGLSQLGRKDVVTLYSLLQEDTGFGFLSYAQPTSGYGSFGVSIVNLHSNNFKRVNDFGDQTGTFGTSSTALLLSQSVGIGTRMSLGGTLKAVRQQIDDKSANGYGADVGVMGYMTPAFQLGFIIRNAVAPQVKLESSADKYPQDLVLGSKWKALRNLTLAADVGKAQNESVKLSLGGDLWLSDLIAFRLGINNNELATGLGVAFGDWGLDYAFGYPLGDADFRELGNSHKFGLHVNFGPPVAAKADRFGWQKKGQAYLAGLREKMDTEADGTNQEVKRLVQGTRTSLKRDGYGDAKDVHAAQAYVYYYQNDYATSAREFSKALEADPDDPVLKRHLQKAQSHSTTEEKEEVGEYRMKQAKELYRNGDWLGTIRVCETILLLNPGHPKATLYLKQARAKIVEPEMAVAKQKFKAGQYVDAFIHFKKVKEIDPENAEANEYLNRVGAILDEQHDQPEKESVRGT